MFQAILGYRVKLLSLKQKLLASKLVLGTIPVISVLRRLKQEAYKFKGSLSYIASSKPALAT